MSKTKKGSKAVKTAPKKASRGKVAKGRVKTTVTTTHRRKQPPPTTAVLSPDVWKRSIVLGQPFNSTIKKELCDGKWNFQLRAALTEHPKCDVYVYPTVESPLLNGTETPTRIPVLCALFVPMGHKGPPKYVAVQNFQAGKDDILSMKEVGLSWEEVNGLGGMDGGDFQGKQFILTSSGRNTKTAMACMSENALHQSEYMTPFTMSSYDWMTEAKDDSKLYVQYAKFEYTLPDGVAVHEEFDREGSSLGSFIVDFCERYELDIDEHKEGVKAAIKQAFQEKREANQNLKDLLVDDGYDRAALDTIKLVKVYPAIVGDQNYMDSYVSKYYGRASKVYVTDAMDLD